MRFVTAQVAGAGVQGLCSLDGGPPLLVRFGRLEFIANHLACASHAAGLRQLMTSEPHAGAAGAAAFLTMAQTPLAAAAAAAAGGPLVVLADSGERFVHNFYGVSMGLPENLGTNPTN